MSNKTQLSTNNDKLASLIQELANKAAGGGESSGYQVATGTFTPTSTSYVNATLPALPFAPKYLFVYYPEGTLSGSSTSRYITMLLYTAPSTTVYNSGASKAYSTFTYTENIVTVNDDNSIHFYSTSSSQKFYGGEYNYIAFG